MIIPRLYGRLGNQCFQIAAAVAHAKKMGTNWGAPHKTLDPRLWPMYFRNLPFTKHVTIAHYKEPRHCYDPLPLQKDMTIDGYFQSEKYFADAKKDVASALGFKMGIKRISCAIHIRRGDYLQYQDQFPTLPIDYYRFAMELMGGITDSGYHKFRIYSDDIEWCKQAFHPDKKLFNLMAFNAPLDIEFSLLREPLTAMRDMYNADAFIIANSTFSLFPALLRTDNPLVIAPAEHRWYGPKNAYLETKDLMPERFIKI